MSAKPEVLRARTFPRDRLAWVACLAGLALAVAGAHAWLHRPLPRAARAGEPTRDFRLPVLAYDRVGEGAGAVEPPRLARHLDALRGAGFQPVSLREVRDAFRGGAPLPARPVLLMFDGGHLGTHRAVDPLLRARGWPAVMTLDPALPERREPSYAYWDRLERMVDGGLWELAVLGPWAEGAALLARRLGGRRALAHVRRAGDPPLPAGAGAPDLAFENGLFGVNEPGADPLRLVRLRAPRDAGGLELVERLEASLAPPGTDGAPERVPASRWVAAHGRVEHLEAAVALSGAPRAEAFVAGTEWATDFVLDLEVRAERGTFWIVQQAAAGDEQWRWGGHGGARFLQRVIPGHPAEVIAQVDGPLQRRGWHRVRVARRGPGVWVEWDGETPHPPGRVRATWRGPVGIAAGTPEEPGRVLVRNVRFATLPYEVRAVAASPATGEVQQVLSEAARVAAISPPGLVVGRARVERERADLPLLRMLAARGAFDLLPRVELSHPAAASPAHAREIAALAAAEGWDGVRLAPGAAGADALAAWAPAMRERGLRVVLEPARIHAGGASP